MLMGSTQWAITLGRFDVQYTINTLARFAQQPSKRNMKRAPRLFGYLKYNPQAKLYSDPTFLDHEHIKFENNEWKHIFPDASEAVDDNAPSPKSKEIQLTIFKDTSHGSDLRTTHSITVIFILPWTCTKQNLFKETGHYGNFNIWS